MLIGDDFYEIVYTFIPLRRWLICVDTLRRNYNVVFSRDGSIYIIFLSGNIKLCPEAIIKMSTGVDLTQYGNHCYQFDPNEVIWQEAEYTCRTRGGHLVDIENQAVNDFIRTFVNDNSYFPVWIGFHDRTSEEHFEWISGIIRQCSPVIDDLYVWISGINRQC